MVDVGDNKVYVYDADGNHQSDRDFDLATGNSYPSDIAWDGAYFYVVDDNKVYVYDADGTTVRPRLRPRHRQQLPQ